MQTLTKNKQEVKYLRQTDGSLKLQLPLITLKPLKSETFFSSPFCRSLANTEGRESIFPGSWMVSECLLSVSTPALAGSQRPHSLQQEEPAGWSLRKIIFWKMCFWGSQRPAQPAASPPVHKGGTAPCFQHWKQEQIWQQLHSREQPEKTR